jgi:hypothetical protein
MAGQLQGATSELTGATGRVPGNAVRGGAHPSARYNGETAEDASSGGVHWHGGSSDGRWRWRHEPAVSVRRRRGEGRWEVSP